MYERFMKKYGRAIDNADERKMLYVIYKMRNITLICALLSWLAFVLSALFVIDTDDYEKVGDFILVFALLLISIILAVLFVVFAIELMVKYGKILTRAPQEGETPEVVAYRQKVVAGERRAKKSNVVGTIFLVVGIVVLMAMFACDFAWHPDSDNMSALSFIGIAVFAVCLMIFMFLLAIAKNKAVMKGETVAMQTSDEAAVIDEKNGIKHKYSVRSDKGVQNVSYLLPNRSLYAKFKEAQTKNNKILWIVLVAFSLVFFVAGVIVFRFVSTMENYRGYAFPAFLTIILALDICLQLPYMRKAKKIENLQKQEFEKYPVYAKNAEIFRMYEAHSKFKGKTQLMALAFSMVCGWVLGILFPNKIYSAFSFLFTTVGVFLNAKFVSDLRQKVIPIEKAIDEELDKVRFNVDATSSVSNESVECILTPYTVFFRLKTDLSKFPASTLSVNIGSDIKRADEVSLPCGFTLEIDPESKTIVGVSGKKPTQDEDLSGGEVFVSQSDLCGTLKIDCEGDYPPYCFRNLDFPKKYVYDAEKKIMQFGEADENSTTYRVFNNVYVDLTAEGYLTRLTIVDLSFDGETDAYWLAIT